MFPCFILKYFDGFLQILQILNNGKRILLLHWWCINQSQIKPNWNKSLRPNWKIKIFSPVIYALRIFEHLLMLFWQTIENSQLYDAYLNPWEQVQMGVLALVFPLYPIIS